MGTIKAGMTLNPGPIPLYHQLEQEIRARILGREFEFGAVLPTEERLCEQYGVSRITVRRALDALIAEGLVTKRRGVGTFATPPQGTGVRSVRLSGSLDEFLASAGALATTVLSHTEIAAPPEALAGLRLREGENVTHMELMSFLDGAPLGYQQLYLPVSIGRQIRPMDVRDHLPIIRMVEKKLGLRVVRAEQVIEADVAGDAAAKHLSLTSGTPVLKVTRIYFDMTGSPVEMIVARHHPQRYKYSIDFIARPKMV